MHLHVAADSAAEMMRRLPLGPSLITRLGPGWRELHVPLRAGTDPGRPVRLGPGAGGLGRAPGDGRSQKVRG